MFRFALIGVMVAEALVVANERQKAEAARLGETEKSMSPEDFKVYMVKYEADKDAARQRETEERRHRERCEAIRSTSFWRFGA